jgi:hypothetical protein
MPLNSYFKGSGQKIMNNLHKKYGDKKGTSVFYALENKRKDKKSNRRIK